MKRQRINTVYERVVVAVDALGRFVASMGSEARGSVAEEAFGELYHQKMEYLEALKQVESHRSNVAVGKIARLRADVVGYLLQGLRHYELVCLQQPEVGLKPLEHFTRSSLMGLTSDSFTHTLDYHIPILIDAFPAMQRNGYKLSMQDALKKAVSQYRMALQERGKRRGTTEELYEQLAVQRRQMQRQIKLVNLALETLSPRVAEELRRQKSEWSLKPSKSNLTNIIVRLTGDICDEKGLQLGAMLEVQLAKPDAQARSWKYLRVLRISKAMQITVRGLQRGTYRITIFKDSSVAQAVVVKLTNGKQKHHIAITI